MENIKFFTFPNGRKTVLFRNNNSLMLVDAETHKVLGKKRYLPDGTILRKSFNDKFETTRESTIIPASKSTKGRMLFDLFDGPLSMHGEIDEAGKMVECWKNNIGDAVEKLGPLARKLLKQV